MGMGGLVTDGYCILEEPDRVIKIPAPTKIEMAPEIEVARFPAMIHAAGSTSHRNELGELLRWFHESERLARTVVEARGEPGEVLRAVHGEISRLGHVLTE